MTPVCTRMVRTRKSVRRKREEPAPQGPPRGVLSDRGLAARRTGGTKGERRPVTSRAPPLLLQRKPYLTGSPPSRRERRCRQECRVPRVYRGFAKISEQPSP